MKQLSFLYREIVSFWYRIFNEKALIQLQFEVSCKNRQTPLYSSFITFRSTTRHEQANAQIIGCIATTAAASVGPVFAVNIMTLCAMYRLPWVTHRKCRTCTHIHTHLQSITKEYSFAPSTSGHPLRYELWVHSWKNKKERKKTEPLTAARQSSPLHDERMVERAHNFWLNQPGCFVVSLPKVELFFCPVVCTSEHREQPYHKHVGVR